ncbi:hypothetical protein L7F22_026877 [Adiantum nelumboides]|nr:hypothetical protein [Adiantum nelumboides]
MLAPLRAWRQNSFCSSGVARSNLHISAYFGVVCIDPGRITGIDEIKAIWQKRWDWFHRLLHAVAHVLHPLWCSEDQPEFEELEEGSQTYVERWCGGDVEMLRRIEDDLLAFRNNTGNFTRAIAKLRETQLQPVSWWEKYGNGVPTLKRLAIRVLSQDCSSGSCERNWSTWALYHTKRKNKLTSAQLERLVYCNCNLKLLEQAAMGSEPMQVNVDKIDIEKVCDIPTIPQEERDLYTLLYEETSIPAHDTRGTRRERGRLVAASTSAVVGDVSSSCSEEDDESHEDSEESSDSSDASVCQYIVWIMDIRILTTPSGYEVRPKIEVVKPKVRGSAVGDAAMDDNQSNRAVVGQGPSREMEGQGQAQIQEKQGEVSQKRSFDQAFTGTSVSNGDEASKLVIQTGHAGGSISTPVAATLPASLGLPKPAANYGVDYWNGQGTPLVAAPDPSRPHPVPGAYVHAAGSMSFHGPSSDGGSTDYWMQDDKELKRQRRKEANRESARRSRMRKQAECDELAEKVQALTAENDSLKMEVERLSDLCQKLSAENLSLLEQLKK